MRALDIGLDKNLFIDGSESQKRMAQYGELLDSLDMLVLAKKGFQHKTIGGNVRVWPTGSLYKPGYFFDGLVLGRKLIAKNNIDVIIAQDPLFTGLIGFILARLSGKKLLVGVYGNNVYDPYWRNESLSRKFLAVLGGFILRRADAIQVDGLETVEVLEKKFPGKVFWKPMVPPDLSSFGGRKEREEGAVNVIFIGRMVKQKNIPMLAGVIEEVSKTVLNKKVNFTMVGDGPYAHYLSRRLAGRKVINVSYVRRSSRESLGQLLPAQDILILTSRYEGFPRVFMEAAHLGIPIVTTNVSGARNLIVDGESGFVVPQNNIKEFVSRLSALISDNELRQMMSKKIKESFERNFPPGLTVTKQKAVFDYLKNIKR